MPPRLMPPPPVPRVLSKTTNRRQDYETIPKPIHEALVRNCQLRLERQEQGLDEPDVVPVVKLFTPDAACKAREIKAKFAGLDPVDLPSVDQAKQIMRDFATRDFLHALSTGSTGRSTLQLFALRCSPR